MLLHQCWDICFQDIAKDQRKIVGIRHGFGQYRGKGGVHFHRNNLVCIFTERLRQGADPGADFQYAAGFVNPRTIGDFTGYPALGQKVLPLGLGKVKPMLLQQGLNHVDIAEIHEKPAFCRFPGG